VEVGVHEDTFDLEAIYNAIPKPQPPKRKKHQVKTESDIDSIPMDELVAYYL